MARPSTVGLGLLMCEVTTLTVCKLDQLTTGAAMGHTVLGRSINSSAVLVEKVLCLGRLAG